MPMHLEHLKALAQPVDRKRDWSAPSPKLRPADIIAEALMGRGVTDELLAINMSVSVLTALRVNGFVIQIDSGPAETRLMSLRVRYCC
jgi:hypothetical protein